MKIPATTSAVPAASHGVKGSPRMTMPMAMVDSGPIMPTLESLLDDPHLKAIGYFETVEHPSEGTIRQMTVPGTWSESKPGIRRLAPKLGQHSAEVLAEAGYTPDEIARMLAAGVTRQAQ